MMATVASSRQVHAAASQSRANACSKALAASLSVTVALLASNPALSQGAASAPAGSWSDSINSMLNSPAVGAEANRQHDQHINALGAAGAKVSNFLHSDSVLPKISEFIGEVRFGNHNVLSKDGERTIWLIRSLAGTDDKLRQAALVKLQVMSKQGVPEAVNFEGFAHEYGLFGAAKDIGLAAKFYAAAATAGYQPGLYNEAVLAAYGRLSAPDLNASATFLQSAAAVARDASGRVCGLGAFIDFRRKDQPDALAFAKGCNSPLAALPLSLADTGAADAERIQALRKSIATGVNDGYGLLETVTSRNAGTDRQFSYCKYALVNRYRGRNTRGVRDDALRCYDLVTARSGNAGADAATRQQVASGIATFVPGELAALRAMRASNKFRYAMSVPYLPFSQQDVDLFAPLLPAQQTNTHQ